MTNKSIRLVLIGAAFCLVGASSVILASESSQEAPGVLEQAKAALVSAKAAIDSIDIYRRPPVQEDLDEDKALTCRVLEREMTSLMPKTYNYKPGFYDDPIQRAGLWGGTLYWPAYSVVWYGVYYDYRENRRIISAQDRIEILRRLKAERRCFED